MGLAWRAQVRRHNHLEAREWAVGSPKLVPGAHGSGLTAGQRLETCTQSENENRARTGIRSALSGSCTGCGVTRSRRRSSSSAVSGSQVPVCQSGSAGDWSWRAPRWPFRTAARQAIAQTRPARRAPEATPAPPATGLSGRPRRARRLPPIDPRPPVVDRVSAAPERTGPGATRGTSRRDGRESAQQPGADR
jgi:hypothetical protein